MLYSYAVCIDGTAPWHTLPHSSTVKVQGGKTIMCTNIHLNLIGECDKINHFYLPQEKDL